MWRHKINLINFKSQAGSRQVLRGLQNLALPGGGTWNLAAGSWQWQKPLKLLVGVDACNPRSQRRKLSAENTRVSADYRPSSLLLFPFSLSLLTAPFLYVANSNKATLESKYTEKMAGKIFEIAQPNDFNFEYLMST